MEGLNKSITCKLTSPELQARKKTVIRQLKELMIDRVELANGFKYKFAGSDAMIDLIASFIKTERLCCDFFDFDVSIRSDETLWLELTGPNGAKEFIINELTF